MTENIIKVGILHSLTGHLAASETALCDAEFMAIAEINANGGVLGKQVIPVVKDGGSDSQIFVEKAIELIDREQVATVFGCWTSASRKAVLPIFESRNHLLWYPVDYEGQECSHNIFYIGAAPNQQIDPAVDWLLDRQYQKWQNFYLIGSDYVFPYTTNQIIKAQLLSRGAQVQGEEYTPLGAMDFNRSIDRIETAMPDGGVIFSTINGDSNIPFYHQLKAKGMNQDRYPVMSFSIAEQEVLSIGAENCVGHYAAWNYFQSIDTPANQKFVHSFKQRYGQDRVTDDPIEAAYVMIYLWKQAVESAGTIEIDQVRASAIGQSFAAPSGTVTLRANHHCAKIVRIGQILPSGQFQIVYSTSHPIEPNPWNQKIVAKAIEELWQKNRQLQSTHDQLTQKAALLEKTLNDLQTTQTQLIQSEKMSSLGQMVAGVAHEINNPVNFIYGNLNHASKYIHQLSHLIHLYQQYYPNPHAAIQEHADEIDLDFLIEDLSKILASMKIGSDRIREIVLSLRNFSRIDESGKKFVDIHEGIDSTLLILQHRIKSKPGVKIVKQYKDLPLIECYPSQLNQVFMNILSNSIDALEEMQEAEQQSSITRSTIWIYTDIDDRDQIEIRIKDNGAGIPSDLVAKLFDPFFTTKPVGKGTGLGLSICYQIIEKHQGNIQVNSEPGNGTEFMISLPQQVSELDPHPK